MTLFNYQFFLSEARNYPSIAIHSNPLWCFLRLCICVLSSSPSRFLWESSYIQSSENTEREPLPQAFSFQMIHRNCSLAHGSVNSTTLETLFVTSWLLSGTMKQIFLAWEYFLFSLCWGISCYTSLVPEPPISISRKLLLFTSCLSEIALNYFLLVCGSWSSWHP